METPQFKLLSKQNRTSVNQHEQLLHQAGLLEKCGGRYVFTGFFEAATAHVYKTGNDPFAGHTHLSNARVPPFSYQYPSCLQANY